jgi:hypothetical protein
MSQSRTVSISSAAGSVVRDVVPARSHLEDRARTWVAVVVIVDKQEIWRKVPFACSIGIGQSSDCIALELNEYNEYKDYLTYLNNLQP